MLKLNQKIDSRIAYAVIALTIAIAVALPALAGTVYSWRTLDGSQAFTDDPKRIPTRYRDDAERQTMGNLEDYSRYTPSQITTKESYRERLKRRLEQLRGATAGAPEAEVVVTERLGLGVAVGGGTRGSADHISLPLGDGHREPVVIESVRIDTAGEISTHHARVIRRADRVIAVREGEKTNTAPNDRESDPVR